jgi:hypothetical protein
VKTRSASFILAGFSAFCLAAQVRADIFTSTPDLPPLYPDGFYQYPANEPFFNTGLIVRFNNLQDRGSGPVNHSPSGPNEIESYSAQWLGGISVNLAPSVPFTASGPEMAIAFNKLANTTGTFNTELLSMSLTGSSAYGPFMIRESPTLASTGQTTITSLGGGQYQIHSFFDVFTELSLDGGQTWMPSAGSSHVTLEPVPEPSGIGLLVAGIISWSGFRRHRRRG